MNLESEIDELKAHKSNFIRIFELSYFLSFGIRFAFGFSTEIKSINEKFLPDEISFEKIPARKCIQIEI